ncbi:hypothetical protein [Microbacterium terregens]|uniref:Uncharacterized protein n=1 Tax=Microbacterium terregens TaxID=69363 RepID=A0ABV5SX94_9MICO
MKKLTMLAVGVVSAAVVFSAPAAHAREITPDHEIAYALEQVPDGYATSEHTASWPRIGMEMVSSLAITSFAVGSCATGAICAYSGYSLTGSKLSWSSCSTYSTAALPSVGSIANARSSGTLRARNGTTVVATAGAGGQANVWSAVTNVQCS